MPQPLSSIPSATKITLGLGEGTPSQMRPELAESALNIIVEWSLLESGVNGLFVKLLGTKNTVAAAAIFSSIRSQAGQRDAFQAVAASVLENDQERQDLLVAILEVCNKAAKTRNRIAHWIWGFSANLPDAVLLADPTAITTHEAKANEWIAAPMGSKRGAHPDIDRRRIYAYTASDFAEALQRIQRARLLVAGVRRVMPPAITDAPALLRLSAEPELRKELDRLSRDRQSDP
jgi:hypothetical protein